MIDLDAEQCMRVLEKASTAYVACLSEGEPYVTPMSYAIDDGELCFRTSIGRRTEALAEDPQVCVAVDETTDDGGWDSVLVWGKARRVSDEQREARIIAALLHKYGESGLQVSATQRLPIERPVYAVSIDRMSGRSSGGGLSPTTHPGRL
jgi:uncharacterized protein